MTRPFSLARLALAIEEALAASPNIADTLPPHFPTRTFVNRSVRALVAEFGSFATALSFAGDDDAHPSALAAPKAQPPHDPETGEIVENLPSEDRPPAPEPTFDGPEADAPVLDRQPEVQAPDEEDDEPAVPDLGREAISGVAKNMEEFFRQPADAWREATRGTTDQQVPQLVREANARFFDSAQHHHPDLFVTLKAIIEAGRVAP